MPETACRPSQPRGSSPAVAHDAPLPPATETREPKPRFPREERARASLGLETLSRVDRLRWTSSSSWPFSRAPSHRRPYPWRTRGPPFRRTAANPCRGAASSYQGADRGHWQRRPSTDPTGMADGPLHTHRHQKSRANETKNMAIKPSVHCVPIATRSHHLCGPFTREVGPKGRPPLYI